MSLANEIDVLTDDMYRKSAFAGELSSLAKLFSKKYWNKAGDALRKDMNASKSSGAGKPKPANMLEVGIGWIDKGPYADFMPAQPPITERVEVGDAAVIFVKKITHRGGTDITARCVILQAKVGHTAPPLVPIAKPGNDDNDSTKKELRLLEGWPTFDLYKASRSGASLASGITLASHSPDVNPYAWFIGADPQWQSQNRHFWMSGPAKNAAECETSFGTLIERFLDLKKIAHSGLGQYINVGHPFKYDSARITKLRRGGTAVSKDWDELCHQLLAAIPDRSIPKNASGAIAMPGRMGITINSFPGLQAFSSIFPSIRNAWLNLQLGRRPVVLIYLESNAD